MHSKEDAKQRRSIPQKDTVFSVCKERRNTCMGKKSIRRLESKGTKSKGAESKDKSKLTNSERVK